MEPAPQPYSAAPTEVKGRFRMIPGIILVVIGLLLFWKVGWLLGMLAVIGGGAKIFFAVLEAKSEAPARTHGESGQRDHSLKSRR